MTYHPCSTLLQNLFYIYTRTFAKLFFVIKLKTNIIIKTRLALTRAKIFSLHLSSFIMHKVVYKILTFCVDKKQSSRYYNFFLLPFLCMLYIRFYKQLNVTLSMFVRTCDSVNNFFFSQQTNNNKSCKL